MRELLDLAVSNGTLLTWALVLGIIALIIFIVFTILGHWPWHRP